MQENTNKAIAINSLILYARLVITAITGLLSTRFALLALGANDYGLFSVIGGIISFIAIINTIMVGTSNRFIATAIGKGIMEEIKDQFNVNLIIHVCIAILVLFVAIPLGHFYIDHYVNYDGNIEIVKTIYDITTIGSVIAIVGVPFHGLLMAKERFIVFSTTDVIAHFITLMGGYIILNHFVDKLFIYALFRFVAAAFPTLVFVAYCRIYLSDYVAYKWVKKLNMYKEVFSFSIWVAYGAFASVGKAQGATLLVNSFFNTIMNTAMGVAASINGIVLNFSKNVSQSIAPQITKSYASGDYKRSELLVCRSSRYSFLVMLLVSSPFLINTKYILGLWLGQVPSYAVIFTLLMIIDGLVGSLNAGIPNLIFASGNIKWYQLIVNTLYLLSILVAYLVLKAGYKAYYLQVTYIVFSAIVLVVRQIVLNKVVKFNNRQLLITSYFPSLTVLVLFLPCCFLIKTLHPVIQFTISLLYLVILVFYIGLQKSERVKLVSFIQRKLLHTKS